MLKRLGVVIPSTILTLLMAVGFSTPAFAFVDTTEVMEEPTQVIEEEKPTEEEKIPFTIAGNGEVKDDIVDDPSKEFFTVKTKGGNTFFLVIDRARNSENVYMLSMIDEYDLQEFAVDEQGKLVAEDLWNGFDDEFLDAVKEYLSEKWNMPNKDDVVSEIIEKAAPVPDNSAQDYSDVPVYYEPFSYAKENDEVDLYRTSYRLNGECKQAIHEAIADNYDGILETDGDKPVQEAMTELLAEFGCDVAQGRVMDAAELREQADMVAEQQAEVLKEKLAAERPAPEETLSFYVAECLEFTFAGEFHDHLTMEEALEAYDKIPSERMNADKCIGFCIEEDGGFVGMYELVVNDKVQRENINSINYFRDDKLVQQAISDMEKLMAARQQNKEQERSSTKKSVLDALHSLKAKKQEQPAQEQDKPKKAKTKGMEL